METNEQWKQRQWLRYRWVTLAIDNGLDEDDVDRVYDFIEHYYNDPLRHYHGLEHIYWLLNGQEEFFPDASDSVKLAIWFHDIFYVPGHPANEKVSAEIFAALMGKYVDAATRVCVDRYIRWTQDHEATSLSKWFPEGGVVCDLDLMGLGGPPDRYDANTSKIRKEYGMYSDAEWNAGKKDFLEKRLKRAVTTPIFQTQIMRDRFEQQAIKNMQRELEDINV